MKHAKPMKRALSVLLALVLSLSLVTPTWAAAKTPASGTGNGLTWEKIDNRSTDLRLDKNNAEKVAQDTPEYADTDVVRVSIVLKDASTLAKGYSSEDIATNSAAMKYRQKLETKQEKMAKTISKKALGGEALDVVWNLTLAANIISANVEYGQIEKIEKISGVEAVLIETRYEPCVVKDNETTDPNMATSGSMIGSNVAWADGYTGAGSQGSHHRYRCRHRPSLSGSRCLHLCREGQRRHADGRRRSDGCHSGAAECLQEDARRHR